MELRAIADIVQLNASNASNKRLNKINNSNCSINLKLIHGNDSLTKYVRFSLSVTSLRGLTPSSSNESKAKLLDLGQAHFSRPRPMS